MRKINKKNTSKTNFQLPNAAFMTWIRYNNELLFNQINPCPSLGVSTSNSKYESG
jgi:hypothetical protein